MVVWACNAKYSVLMEEDPQDSTVCYFAALLALCFHLSGA